MSRLCCRHSVRLKYCSTLTLQIATCRLPLSCKHQMETLPSPTAFAAVISLCPRFGFCLAPSSFSTSSICKDASIQGMDLYSAHGLHITREEPCKAMSD